MLLGGNAMRKIVASLLTASLLWCSLVLPARALPVLPLVAYLLEVAGAYPLITSVAIHTAAIVAIELTNNGSSPTSNRSNVAIQIQLDPYTPLIKPESAVGPAVVDSITDNVVQSEQQLHYALTGLTTHRSYSLDALAAAYLAEYRAAGSPAFAVGCSNVTVANYETRQIFIDRCPGYSDTTTVAGLVTACVPGDTWNGSACVRPQTTCPPDYTLNTGDNKCYANNPDEVQVADAKLQIQRILDKFQKNPNDPDTVPDHVSIEDKDITIQTPERTTKVHINDDSTVDIREIVHTPDGNTQENKVKLSAPTPGNAPEVISKSTSNYPGQSSAPSPAPGVPGGPVIPGTGVGESGTPTGSATPTTVLNLPDNLARTDKQCGYDAAHPCKVELQGDGKLKVDEDGTPEEFTSDHGDQIDAKFDELESFIEQQTDGVGQGLENPLIGKFSGSECTNPLFSVTEVHPNAVASIPACDHIPQLHPWLALLAYVMSALAIYRIWFTRQGGGS
jgi:hypothetical protein